MVNILLLRNSLNEAGLINVKVKLIVKAVHLIGTLGLFLLNPLFEQLIEDFYFSCIPISYQTRGGYYQTIVSKIFLRASVVV